jgi:hypothetical protein
MVMPPLAGAAAPKPLGLFTIGGPGLRTRALSRTKKGVNVNAIRTRLTVRARANNGSDGNRDGSNSHSGRGFGNRGGEGGEGGVGGGVGGGGVGGVLASLRGAAGGVIISAAAASCLLLGAPSSVSVDAMVSKLTASLGVPAAYADDDVDGRAEAAVQTPPPPPLRPPRTCRLWTRCGKWWTTTSSPRAT